MRCVPISYTDRLTIIEQLEIDNLIQTLNYTCSLDNNNNNTDRTRVKATRIFICNLSYIKITVEIQSMAKLRKTRSLPLESHQLISQE